MNYYPVTVVENFYEDPDAIRKFALAQDYKFCHEIPNINYVFPGSRTKELLDLDRKLFEKVSAKLISLFHNPELDHMRWLISTSFQSVTEEYGRGVIHTDNNTILAAVLYLNPEPEPDSGTSLFKKNRHFDEAAYAQAIKENDTLFRQKHKVMREDYHRMFDEIVRVNNVYNSLIVYEGDTFHAANRFFGKTLQDSRLAQVFFVNRIDAKKESVFPLRRVRNIKA
ncbi:DUF6445 family protein [Methylobacillus flagellatus]|uniref:DUF6445 family protein n=1 Tax=Methylobacillus flagellatus TaxID=405 RepID=UPI0010F8B71C|nr:DUF6445 family protein [Methylobacillus flagellatus]